MITIIAIFIASGLGLVLFTTFKHVEWRTGKTSFLSRILQHMNDEAHMVLGTLKRGIGAVNMQNAKIAWDFIVRLTLVAVAKVYAKFAAFYEKRLKTHTERIVDTVSGKKPYGRPGAVSFLLKRISIERRKHGLPPMPYL